MTFHLVQTSTVNDIVVYGNRTYRCIQNHLSNSVVNLPELDLENSPKATFSAGNSIL